MAAIMPSRNNRKSLVILLMSCVCLLATSGYASDTLNIRFTKVQVMMPDSIHLATDLYLPADEGAYPVILIRTPYDSKNVSWLAEPLAQNGYAVVAQNVRGVNGSEGEFFPFAYSKSDGSATLEWITRQPWFGGKVGLWGISYHGFTAFALASTGHPAVASIMHNAGWADLEPFMTHGGAFHLMAHLRWFYSYMARRPNPPEEAWDGIFRTVPISQFFMGTESAMEELAAQPYPYDNIDVPVLHVAGWYDYIYPNVLETYNGIEAAHPDGPLQKLIMGPWAHNDVLQGDTKVADEEYGPQVKMGLEKYGDLTRKWFDHTLKGIDNAIADEKPVRIFVMRENQWHEFDSWPPEATAYHRWYIDDDNTLTRDLPSGDEYDTFVFDPNDPVPTVGGANFHFFPKNLGPMDQSEVEKRSDMLVYTSSPLDADMLIVGPIKAVVYASTEGKDTDFTAKLVVVQPDGYARNIEDGIIRGSYQFDDADGLEPGTVYPFEIDLGATGLQLYRGERLRLEISSSNFPKYDRNPNTGVDAFEATEFMPVTQTVYHSPEYPTHVIIPVLPD